MEAVMTRRRFGSFGLGFIGLLASAGSLVTATACSVVDNILKYVPVALQALAAILSVLAGNGVVISPVVTAAIALAKAALADLQTAITDYNNAPAANKANLLGMVSTALAVVEADIQKFWSDLSLPDGKIASIVSGILGIVLSTLAAFATQLPAPVVPAATKTMRAELKKTIPVVAKKRSPKEMKKEINALLQGTGIQIY